MREYESIVTDLEFEAAVEGASRQRQIAHGTRKFCKGLIIESRRQFATSYVAFDFLKQLGRGDDLRLFACCEQGPSTEHVVDVVVGIDDRMDFLR